MKVPKETIEKIAGYMRVIAAGRDMPPNMPDAGLWNLWHAIVNEHRADDTHPRFKHRDRRFPLDRDFELYPHNTNDDTMTTALRAAYKQAFSVEQVKSRPKVKQ